MLHQQPTKVEMPGAELLMKRSGQLDANLKTVNKLEKTSAKYHKVLTARLYSLLHHSCSFCCKAVIES